MKERLLLLSLIGLFTITGCSQRPVPVATSYPSTAQRKMQAIHHWDVLAANVADRIQETLNNNPELAVLSQQSLPIYIRTTPEQQKAAFGKTFDDLLRNQLIQRGLFVITNKCYRDKVTRINDANTHPLAPDNMTRVDRQRFRNESMLQRENLLDCEDDIKYDNPLMLEYEMQVTQHKHRRVGGLLLGPVTSTEVAITTSMTLGNQYIFGDTAMYYINTGDQDHYENDSRSFNLINCRAGNC